MARSIHSTYSEFFDERRFQYAEEQLKNDRLSRARENIYKKRRIKRNVQKGRKKPVIFDIPAIPVEGIPIQIIDDNEWIHYPASPDDIRAVMKQLPPGVLNGLAGIRLSLGKADQQVDLSRDERSRAERDPWLDRIGFELIPGVYAGRILGEYFHPPARIHLYAYLFDPSMAQLSMWQLFLRLHMLSTLVHEIAHHDDYMRRVARGRWRADDTDKKESYAEETSFLWVVECVVPYLEDAYALEVRELKSWIRHNGGTDVPLELLTDSWQWDEDGKAVKVVFGSVLEAFKNLVDDVNRGNDLTSTRLGFARDLHYGENYEDALRIIACVLEYEPDNLEALTLRADILEHQQNYSAAEQLALRVLALDERYVDAWMVLADVYEALGDWGRLLMAADRGLKAVGEKDWRSNTLLEQRARANLELKKWDNVACDLEKLSRTRHGLRVADTLRALLQLRLCKYEDALQTARQLLEQRRPRLWRRDVLLAVQFEAAHKLGLPKEAGELSGEIIERLRRCHFNEWADSLTCQISQTACQNAKRQTGGPLP